MLYAHLSFGGREPKTYNKKPEPSHGKQPCELLQFSTLTVTLRKHQMKPEGLHFLPSVAVWE